MDSPGDYVFYERPAEVWAVEFTNLNGDRVVEVVGTEYAAWQAAEQYGTDSAVLHSLTDFHSVAPLSKPVGAQPWSNPKRAKAFGV